MPPRSLPMQLVFLETGLWICAPDHELLSSPKMSGLHLMSFSLKDRLQLRRQEAKQEMASSTKCGWSNETRPDRHEQRPNSYTCYSFSIFPLKSYRFFNFPIEKFFNFPIEKETAMCHSKLNCVGCIVIM